MFWLSRQKRMAVTVALLIGLVVMATIVGASYHATAAAGRTYSGTIGVEDSAGGEVRQLSISFRVSADGRRVEDFRFRRGLPQRCRGVTVGHLRAASTPIFHPSRFLARLAVLRDGTQVGTLLIGGTFASLDREDGGAEIRFSAPDLRRCDATSAYSARA